MDMEAGEAQYELIGDLAVRILNSIPEHTNDGLLAGALGVCLGRAMADSFNSSLLMRNMLRMAEFAESVQGDMNAEDATKH